MRRYTSWIKLLLLGGLLLTSFRGQASHIVGGDIAYTCLGNDKYEIELNVFRDCFYGDPAAFFDNPASVGVFNQFGVLVTEVKLFYMGDDTLDSGLSDPCLFDPGDVCVHATTYRKTVTLPPITGGYRLVYQRCCRNQTINNIMAPDETGATYSIQLKEESIAECNSSPKFGAVAPTLICVGKEIDYDHSATDVEGDSLVYRLCTPLSGGSLLDPQPIPPAAPPYDTIQWVAPYSEDDMLGNPDNPLTIDPQTGHLSGIPNIVGQFVVGVCVEEYRNGVLLSTVRRDFQYNVVVCGEIISAFFAPEAQCDNLTVEFDNQSTLSNDFQWYFDSDDDLSLQSTQENPVFTFPDTGTYNVMLIAEPGSVCVDTFTQEIFLQYNSLFPGFDIDVFDCSDSSVVTVTDMTFDTVTSPIDWQWTLSYNNQTLTSSEQNPSFYVPYGIMATLELTALSETGCEQTITQSFQTGIDNPGGFLEDSFDICLGDSVALNPNFQQISNYPYMWSPAGLFDDPTEPNPTVSPDTTTVYTVMIESPGGVCVFEKEITVNVTPLPELDFDYEVNCDGYTVDFTNGSTNSPGYFWNFGDPGSTSDTSTDPNPSYTYPDFGQYAVSLSTPASALCRDTVIQVIDVPERILEAGFTFEMIDCETNDQVIAFTDQSVNNLTSTIQWDWDFGGLGTASGPTAEITVTNNQTITATLTITTDEGCTDTYSETFDVELTQIDIETPKLICRGDSVALNPTGNPNYEYLWTPATGLDDPTSWNPMASPQQTTIYSVEVTNVTFDTCIIQRNIIVVVPADIDLSTTGDILTCDPEATVLATTVQPANLQWVDLSTGDTISTNNTITVPVSGTTEYQVIATDPFGCTELENVIVEGGPVAIEAGPEQIVCSDEPINVFVNNLDPNDDLSYAWSPGSGIINGGNTANPTVSNTPGETTYYVNVISQYGCTASDSVFVAVVDSDIDLDFLADVQCDGSTVVFTNQSSNAYNYVWNFGDPNSTMDTSTLENPVYNYSDTGTYYVQLTILYNDLTCVDDAVQPILIEEPILFADFEFEYTDCTTDSIVISFTDLSFNFLDDTNEWTWTFSNGEVLSEQNPTITILPFQVPLTANLMIGSETGCEASYSELIDIDFIETTLSDTIILCFGDTTELNPFNNQGYVYEWFPATGLSDANSPNPDAFPTETTTYYGNITNFGPDTCSIQKSVTIIVPTPIEVDATEDLVTCWEPVDLTVSSNVSPLDFTWYADGDSIAIGTDINVVPDTTTIYTVIGVDEFGCFNTDTLEVIVPESIILEATPDSITCGDPIILEATSNVDPLDYEWTLEDGTIISNDSLVEVDPVVSDVYYIDVFDQYGCTVGDSVMVTNGEVDLSTNGLIVICPIDSTQLTATNLDMSDTLEYIWTVGVGNGQVLSDGDTPNPWVEPVPGINIFYVDVVNQYGCTFLDSVTVIMSDFNPVTLDTVEACPGIPTALNPNGNPNYSYQWSPGFGLSDSTIANPEATLFEDIVYTVTITDFDGVDTCGATVLVYVAVNPDMELEAFGDTTLCEYVDVDVSANSDFAVGYTWYDNPELTNEIGDEQQITVSPVGENYYYVVAEDDLGCLDTAEVLINSFPLDFDLQDEYILCINDELELTVINNAGDQVLTYLWDPIEEIISGGTSATAVVSPLDTTMFYVAIENQYGCEGYDSTLVNIIDLGIGLFATADPDTIIFNSGEFSQLLTLDDPNLIYTWTPGESLDFDDIFDPQAIPDETTTYVITVEGENGCTAFREVTVVVIDPNCIEPFVFIPSGFTPNGDGNNDVLYVRGNNIDEMYLAIYNRWGQKLFESDNKDFGWDGTFKGKELPPDTYGFYLEVNCFNGETYFKKGNITLIR